MEATGEGPEFYIKSPLGAPLQIFPQCYLRKSFPQEDTSARQQVFEIRVFPLLGELPKAIKPQQPVYQLSRWQLGPTMWSLNTTMSIDHIVVTDRWRISQGKSRTCHGWICLQLSGARGMDNGDVRADCVYDEQKNT